MRHLIDFEPHQPRQQKAYCRAVQRARAIFSNFPIIRNAQLAPDDYLLMAADLEFILKTGRG